MSAPSVYAQFPVNETISISSTADVCYAADKMVEAYSQCQPGTFSYRLLLPRGEKLTAEARKLGHALQGEFLLALRNKRVSARIKEVRYVHDNDHYGWLLANPEVFDRFEGKDRATDSR